MAKCIAVVGWGFAFMFGTCTFMLRVKPVECVYCGEPCAWAASKYDVPRCHYECYFGVRGAESFDVSTKICATCTPVDTSPDQCWDETHERVTAKEWRSRVKEWRREIFAIESR